MAKGEKNCSSMLTEEIIYILIERALFALALVGFSPLLGFLNAWFLIFSFALGHPSHMDMELITKLIFAGCVLWRVLGTNQVMFWPTVSCLLLVIAVSLCMKYTMSIEVRSMASPTNPAEDQKKIGKEEKSEEEEEEENACQKDVWFLLVWRMRIGLVHRELQKLFPKAFPGEVHKRRETVLNQVADQCKDTTSFILKDSIHQGVPLPAYGDALGCRTMDMVNAVGHEHAVNLQKMTIKADGLEMMNKHLKSEVEFYWERWMEVHNNNQAFEKKVQELEDKCIKLQQEKLFLCSLLKIACSLCKN